MIYVILMIIMISLTVDVDTLRAASHYERVIRHCGDAARHILFLAGRSETLRPMFGVASRYVALKARLCLARIIERHKVKPCF